MEVVYGFYEEVVGLCEQELSCLWAVYEHTVYARRAKIARRVVFTSQAGGEYCVHKHV